jgi:hypothetical protein
MTGFCMNRKLHIKKGFLEQSNLSWPVLSCHYRNRNFRSVDLLSIPYRRTQNCNSSSCPENTFHFKLRGPFEKFVGSPYYSESELCGGAVTVSFSKYLTW